MCDACDPSRLLCPDCVEEHPHTLRKLNSLAPASSTRSTSAAADRVCHECADTAAAGGVDPTDGNWHCSACWVDFSQAENGEGELERSHADAETGGCDLDDPGKEAELGTRTFIDAGAPAHSSIEMTDDAEPLIEKSARVGQTTTEKLLRRADVKLCTHATRGVHNNERGKTAWRLELRNVGGWGLTNGGWGKNRSRNGKRSFITGWCDTAEAAEKNLYAFNFWVYDAGLRKKLSKQALHVVPQNQLEGMKGSLADLMRPRRALKRLCARQQRRARGAEARAQAEATRIKDHKFDLAECLDELDAHIKHGTCWQLIDEHAEAIAEAPGQNHNFMLTERQVAHATQRCNQIRNLAAVMLDSFEETSVYALFAFPPPFCAMWEQVDCVHLIATVPGRHSGDQVHKVKKTAAPLFHVLLLTFC